MPSISMFMVILTAMGSMVISALPFTVISTDSPSALIAISMA